MRMTWIAKDKQNLCSYIYDSEFWNFCVDFMLCATTEFKNCYILIACPVSLTHLFQSKKKLQFLVKTKKQKINKTSNFPSFIVNSVCARFNIATCTVLISECCIKSACCTWSQHYSSLKLHKQALKWFKLNLLLLNFTKLISFNLTIKVNKPLKYTLTMKINK